MRRRIRKFADRQRTDRQTIKQTESGPINNTGDTTIKEEDEEKN